MGEGAEPQKGKQDEMPTPRHLLPLAALAAVSAALLTLALVGSPFADGGPNDQPPIGSPQPNTPEDLVARAKAHLANRLGIDQAAITLIRLEQVDWPDTSLGNPQPGMVYAQVVTPGYRLLFQAEGQTYEYHTDLGQRVELVQ